MCVLQVFQALFIKTSLFVIWRYAIIIIKGGQGNQNCRSTYDNISINIKFNFILVNLAAIGSVGCPPDDVEPVVVEYGPADIAAVGT